MGPVPRIALIAVVAVRAVSASMASGWSPMTRANYIYFDQAVSSAPDITVSPTTGLPYIVFQSCWDPNNGNNYVIGFAKGTRVGRAIDWSWSRSHPVEVSPRGHKSLGPAIAVGSKDGQEQIHVLWWDHIGTEDLLYSRSTDGGNTWSAPTNLSNSATVSNGHYSAAADNQGNVYVVWSDWYGSPNANGLNIWFRKFNGATQTWEAKKQIESDITSKSQTPKILLDSQGILHVGWTDRLSDPRRFSYTYSASGGATWAPIQTIMTFSTAYDLGPMGLTVASNGVVYAAMATGPAYGTTGPSNLYLSSKNPGATWTAGQVVQGSDPCANPYLTADTSGHVFLSWLKYVDGAFDILYSQHNSVGWSGTSNATRDGLWKGYTGGHIAVDPVNDFVYVATDDTRDGLYHQIWTTCLDLREPPLPIANLTQQAGDRQVVLSWKNQDEPDIGAVRVVFRTDRYPTSPTDGTLAGEQASRCNEKDSFTHNGLTNGVTYYYAVYTRDDYGNFSPGAFISATPGLSSCRGAKDLADGTRADMKDQVVTAIFSSDGCIYVEEPDRSSAIRVAYAGTGLTLGDRLSISGTVGTRVVSGYPAERVINPTSVSKLSSGAALGPLAMGCKAVGGALAGVVPGVKDGVGTNNMGLLVKIAGKVTKVLGTYAFIDDGSRLENISGLGPEVGVMVKCPSTPTFGIGSIVSVTGIIEGSIPTGWTTNRRYIRCRDTSDVVVF